MTQQSAEAGTARSIDRGARSSRAWESLAANAPVESAADLKRKTARGALSSVVGQGANFVLRIASMVILARLVTPEHFGLVGMVTAFTGVLNLLRDAGLPQAAVQRPTLEEDLASTLFWLNFAIGASLATITAIAAPLVASFYGEPRLFWITISLGLGFLLNGASVQHRALLERSMRLARVVAIDICALAISIAVGIGMAIAGLGYWALVGMSIALPAMAMLGLWIVAGWMPGRPRRGTGARSLLRYGGVITINSLVVYVAYNVDKVLLGRFWGAEVLGLYGRAYQLVNIPTENLQSAMGTVMFPALSRVQADPQRVRSYFLNGYSLFLAVVIPITVACGLFAPDIVRVMLGEQWSEAAPVFRLLAPTILAFAIMNPFAHLLLATGLATRSLKLAFLIAPIVILGYLIGLPSGPEGVAMGFSAAMLVLVVPVVYWSKRGTMITGRDLLRATLSPLVSTLVGAVAAVSVQVFLSDVPALLRLVALTAVLFGAHAMILLFALGQKQRYLEIMRTIIARK